MAELAQSIASKVIALAIIVIVISSVVIPVVVDAQDDLYSDINNTTSKYFVKEATIEEIVITASATAYTVNGYEFTVDNTKRILISGNYAIEAYSNYASFGVKSYESASFYRAVSMTISADGTFTATDTSNNTRTGTIEGPILYFAENGTYGEFESDFSFNADSTLYTRIGVTNFAGMTFEALLSGHYDDLNGLAIDTYTNPWSAVDSEKLTYALDPNAYEKVNDYEYRMTIPTTMDVTYTDGGVDTTKQATVSFFYAPIEYTSLTSNDGMAYTLIGIIPMLLIICAVLFAVRMIGSRN